MRGLLNGAALALPLWGIILCIVQLLIHFSP